MFDSLKKKSNKAMVQKAIPKKPKPSQQNRTQPFIGITDVKDGIIITKDKRYLKILEVIPTNFFNKDSVEQDSIVFQFAEYLKTAPTKMQIKVMSIPLDMKPFLKDLQSQKDLPNANDRIRKMIDEQSDMINRDVKINKLKSKRFFIVYEFDEYDLNPTFEYVKKVLNNIEYQTYECLVKCKCDLVNHHMGNGEYNNYALYEYIICHFDRSNKPFEETAENVYNEVVGKNPKKKDSLTIEDYLAPREVAFYDKEFCQINGKYVSYHYIKDYRPYVTAGWLNAPITGLDVDIDIFFEQEDRVSAKKKVRKAVDRHETILENVSSNTNVAQESKQLIRNAMTVRERIYTSGETLYNVSILITIMADTPAELETKTKSVYDLMDSKDFPLLPLFYRQKEGFLSTLPFNQLDKNIKAMSYRNIMSGDMASVFPFNDPAILDKDGVVIGKNRAGRLCALNPFDRNKYEAPHLMILGSTGMGKTYASELLLSRFREKGAKCFAITPIKGHEYWNLCRELGGRYIRFSTEGSAHVNIFDIRKPTEVKHEMDMMHNGSLLAEKLNVVSTYFNILMPSLTALQESLINVAIVKAYEKKGITRDNNSICNEDGTYKEVPIIEDVCKSLKAMLTVTDDEKMNETMPDPTEYRKEINDLLAIMQQFVSGSYNFLNRHTTIEDSDSDYTVFDVTDLDSGEPRILAAVMHTIINHIMNVMVEDISQRKVVLIDETWKLIGDGSEDTAKFVKYMYKIIRAYNGMAISTSQDISDWDSKGDRSILDSIINNSTFQILLGMKPKMLRSVADILALNDEVVKQVQFSTQGDGVVLCAGNSFPIRFDATPTEHECITTKPEEVQALEEKRKKLLGAKAKELMEESEDLFPDMSS